MVNPKGARKNVLSQGTMHPSALSHHLSLAHIRVYSYLPKWTKPSCFTLRKHLLQELKDTPAGLPIAQFPMLLVYYKRECIEVRQLACVSCDADRTWLHGLRPAWLGCLA